MARFSSNSSNCGGPNKSQGRMTTQAVPCGTSASTTKSGGKKGGGKGAGKSGGKSAGKSHRRGAAKSFGPSLDRPTVSAGFAFIVKCGEYEDTASWFYVAFDYGNMLTTSNLPYRVYPQVTPQMHEFWQRVVLDDAYPWEDPQVWPKTMRLVEVKHDVVDVTPELFIDRETYDQSRKLAALSKLTDEEARLLEIGHDYFFLKINQKRIKANEAERLAENLRLTQIELSLEIKQ